MTYPHDTLLRAWLDGKVIQYLDAATGIWIDIEGPDVASKTPHLYRSGHEYRIKPVTVRYRVALMVHYDHRDGYFTAVVDNLQEERATQGEAAFIRWLTDWQEAEA